MALADGHKSRCRYCKEPIVWRTTLCPPGGDDRTVIDTWWHRSGADYQDQWCVRDTQGRSRWGDVELTAKAMPHDLCGEKLTSDNEFYGQMCNRKITVPEVNACGIHAKNLLEDLAVARAKEEREARQEIIKAGIESQIEVLREYGLHARAECVGGYRNQQYTGKLIVDPDELMKLCDEIEEQF